MTELEELIDDILREEWDKAWERVFHRALYGEYHGPGFPEWPEKRGIVQ